MKLLKLLDRIYIPGDLTRAIHADLARIRAAKATEARRAETPKSGSVHDGAVAESDLPK